MEGVYNPMKDIRQPEDRIAEMESLLNGNIQHDEPILLDNLNRAASLCSQPAVLKAAVTGYLMSYKPGEWIAGMIEGFNAEQSNAEIDKAMGCMKNSDVNGAVHIIMKTVSKLNMLFRHHSKCRIYDFDDEFQAYLYCRSQYDTGKLYKAPFNMARANQVCGRIMLAANMLKDAESAFRTAILWNPVKAEHYMDLAAVLYQMQNYKMHEINISLAYSYAYTRDMLRRYYFEMGHVYEAKNEHSFAAELYKYSLKLGDNARVRSALSYLEESWFKKVTPPLDMMHLKDSCMKHAVPYGPSQDILGKMLQYIDENPVSAEHLGIGGMREQLLGAVNG